MCHSKLTAYIDVQNSLALRTISEPGCWYAGHSVTLVQGPFADFFNCFAVPIVTP